MIYDNSPSTWDIVITHSDARFYGGITGGGIKGILITMRVNKGR